MSAATVALVRAHFRSAVSYRIRTILSLLGIVVSVIPVYFVAEALQSTMEASIHGYGGRYFSFLIVGMISLSFVASAATELPDTIHGGIRNGTLEALLSTPAGLPQVLAGMTGYGFLWTGARALVLLLAAWVLGADPVWSRLVPGLLVLGLIVATHIPFGLMAGAMVLAFRTAGPLPNGILALSGLLGGVYYPTEVVPSWLEELTRGLPLTYGLRALRRTFLEGEGLGAVAGDLAVLVLFGAALWAAAILLFRAALTYSRRSGTLAQY